MADSIFGMFSFQESSDEYPSPPLNKKGNLQGHPWKDFSKNSFSFGREEMGKTSAKNSHERQGEKSDSVRKSRRIPKKRVLDGEFDEDDEDAEIRYLEKLKSSKMSGYKDLESHSTRKSQKGVKVEITDDVGRRDPRKRDTDYEVEEVLSSDGEADGKKKKKQKRDLAELPIDNKREIALTTRQRALLSKDAPASGASQVEFPNGLPPAAPRSQYE